MREKYSYRNYCFTCNSSFDRYQSKYGVCPACSTAAFEGFLLEKGIEAKVLSLKELNSLKISFKKQATNCTLKFIKVCNTCKLPKRSNIKSSKRLSSFTKVSYDAQEKKTVIDSDTRLNKLNFEFDRKITFCNGLTCQTPEKSLGNSFQDDMKVLMIDVLGENASKNKKRKFLRYGIE